MMKLSSNETHKNIHARYKIQELGIFFFILHIGSTRANNRVVTFHFSRSLVRVKNERIGNLSELSVTTNTW